MSASDLYAIWIRIPLSEAGLAQSALILDDAKGPMELSPQHVEKDSGRVLVSFESKGDGLPNYSFTDTAVVVSTKVSGAVGYLGVSRLRPDERRPDDVDGSGASDLTRGRGRPGPTLLGGEEGVDIRP